jgi:type VI secretion system secreted protein VgrG
MRISNEGISLLKQLEGCVKTGDIHIIYDDQTGSSVDTNKPLPRGATIGYGHLITADEDFKNGISESQATKLLRTDVAMAEHAVQNTVITPLTQNQYDALVIFAYNIGVKNFTNSTVVKYVNNRNFHSVRYPTLESAWMAWNKSSGREMAGLTKRRKAEYRLFTNRSIWGN